MDRYTFDRGRGRELFILSTEVDAHLAALHAQHAEAIGKLKAEQDAFLKRQTSAYLRGMEAVTAANQRLAEALAEKDREIASLKQIVLRSLDMAEGRS